MIKIMFVCSAGMSTSMLVQRVEKAAAEKGVDVKVWACSESESKQYYDDVDVILLGPQIRFMFSKIEKAIQGRPVKLGIIPPLDYGRLDGEAIFSQAQNLLGA